MLKHGIQIRLWKMVQIDCIDNIHADTMLIAIIMPLVSAEFSFDDWIYSTLYINTRRDNKSIRTPIHKNEFWVNTKISVNDCDFCNSGLSCILGIYSANRLCQHLNLIFRV